ncbi:MAG: slipin family protein, partial [Eggerthella lenta]
RLRAMHLLYESVRETGGTVVVPSSFSEGFGDVLGDAAKDVLGKGSGL